MQDNMTLLLGCEEKTNGSLDKEKHLLAPLRVTIKVTAGL